MNRTFPKVLWGIRMLSAAITKSVIACRSHSANPIAELKKGEIMVQRLLVALASFGVIGATMFTGTSPAQAAPCVSVSYSGLEFSFSTSCKVTFTSSCEGTTEKH